MKKFSSFILAVIMLFAVCVPAFAADTNAKLLNIYGDNMLFKQKCEAVFSGTAQGGARIDVELVNSAGVTVKNGYAYANRSGKFNAGLFAPAGSYENYTVRLYENGVLFRTLNNVVFGELWLASGQSNMQYEMSGTIDGGKLYAEGDKLNEWVRALFVPPVTPYQGSTEKIPAVPQNDIEGAFWITGTDARISVVTAVGYFFADMLEKELHMPVGVISASLGGSSIGSWLSRDAVDSDARVKQDFADAGEYIEINAWDEYGQSMFYDMTANFNLKIAPLAPFNISGMIWYQGETDVIYQWKTDRYSRAFDLMQRSYTENFGYADGLLPIVFTSLASYYYTEEYPMSELNYEFTQMSIARPESRALISIYDVPLDYTDAMGAIHPGYKQPVGERMANAAMGLLYGGDKAYTGAALSGVSIKDGGIEVTFDNTGSGLVCGGDKLFGFSVCGENGVYVQAEAEIISPDTVRIYSDYVAEPVSAAYAYDISNQDANLFTKTSGGETVAVNLFVTDKNAGSRYVKFTAWADCEGAECWRVLADSSHSGVYNTWNVSDADISFDSASAFSGSNGLHITGASPSGFTVGPKMTYREKAKNVVCSDFENDFSDYGCISFRARNNGADAAEIKELRLYKDAAVWYAPAVSGGTASSVSLPADGEWHTVSFDLNRLYLFGNKGGAVYSNEKISEITKIELKFNAKKADISLDEFRFAPETEQGKTSFKGAFDASENIFEYFCAFFTEFISKILRLFPTAYC